MQGMVFATILGRFINTGGPAVAWNPAVPGRAQAMRLRGNPVHTAAFYRICNASEVAHFEFDGTPGVLPIDSATLKADADLLVDFPGAPGLLAQVVAVAAGMEAAEAVTGDAAIARLYAHIAPEAFGLVWSVRCHSSVAAQGVRAAFVAALPRAFACCCTATDTRLPHQALPPAFSEHFDRT